MTIITDKKQLPEKGEVVREVIDSGPLTHVNFESGKALTVQTVKHKMGTIEPIYDPVDKKTGEQGGYDKLGFIRGCITKYRNTPVPAEDILKYIEGIANSTLQESPVA